MCVGSVFLMPKVKVNYDLSTYLSSKTETKKAINAMSGEFEDVGMLKLLVEGKTEAEVETLIDEIKKIDGVITASSQFKDGDYLISININSGSYSADAEEITEKISRLTQGGDYKLVGSTVTSIKLRDAIAEEMPIIMLIAVIIVLFVLTLTSRSWLEPVIFTVVVAMAILINMGTNVIFDSISYITNAVGAILQLALAMDYSIILLNNYSKAKAGGLEGKDAVTDALAKSIAPIASSALTTIAGLLALVFMSFKIGFDIGIVLSKGIIFSMLCVFFVMPALIILLEKPISKLSHKPIRLFGDKIAKGSIKARKVLPIVFVLLVVAAAIVSGLNTTYTYAGAMASEDEKYITEKFGYSTQVVLLYDNNFAVEEERELSERLKTLDGVEETLGWGAVKLTPELIGQSLRDMDSAQIEIMLKFLPENLRYVSSLYDAVSASEDFVADCFEERLSVERLMEITETDRFSASAIVALLGDGKTVSLSEIIDGVAERPEIGALMSEEQKALIENAAALRENSSELSARLESALSGVRPMLVSNRYRRMLVTLSVPIEDEGTYMLLENIKREVDSFVPENYMAGESVINRDIATSFKLDNVLINVFTVVAILIIVGLTFVSLSVPVLLVAIIQGAIWISMSVSAIFGSPVFFISYIICVCIQMGATIDYGILITDFYLRARGDMERKEAAIYAVNEAMPTIFTSGIILIVAAFLIGSFSSIMPISSIGMLLSRGSIVSVLTVLFVLPALLILLDKPILALTKRYKEKKNTKK